MAPARSAKDSASEISRRYGLEDLTKARGFARRYYVNALASKAFSLVYDMLPADEDLDYALPGHLRHGLYRRPYHHLRDFPVIPRRSLPTATSRMLYDRRLSDNAAARREALKRAEVLSRYYLDDPLALLDGPDEDLDFELDDDNNEGPSAKNEGAGATEKGTDNTPASNEHPEDHHPALPDSRYSRRHRYPRLTAEAIYRILDAGI